MPSGGAETERPNPGSSDGGPLPVSRRGMWSWFLFDWANSPFPTVVITFVFGTYFTKAVAPDTVTGTALWGYTVSASALLVAILAPIFGAYTDFAGRRKPWLLATTALAILACALLWFGKPEAESILWILVFVGIANFAFELSSVFYNAMLPDLAPPGRIGRWSGWAWSLGYAGGLLCLVLALVGFVQTDDPWFGVSKENAENVRAVAILVAVWYAVFAWPLFAFTPDRPRSGLAFATATRRGLAQLYRTLRHIRREGQIFRFLIARMIYTDGLTTLFAFGGIYAEGTFDMGLEQVILFGIALNVTSGLGAAAFAWIDDLIGGRRTVIISLFSLIVLSTAILLITSVTWFWILGLMIGIFIGPVQAASRSLMGRLAPPEKRTEMFGMFALSGKATAFVGPALLGWVASIADSQRAGMATILIFFVAGLIILWPVVERPREDVPEGQ